MISKSKRARAQRQEQARQPHAQADIADLQAWAVGGNAAPAPRPDGPSPANEGASTRADLPGGPLLPKLLVVAGVVLVGYLAFLFLVHLVMMLLMVVGGIAAVYAAYRIGYWRGQRSGEPVRTMPWLGSGRRRD